MNRIKQLRKLKNMKQEDLAELLNVQRSAISKYETEKVPLTAETLNKLSEIFDVSIDYILCKNNDPTLSNKKAYSADTEQSEDIKKLEKILSELCTEDLKTLAEHAEFLASRHKK